MEKKHEKLLTESVEKNRQNIDPSDSIRIAVKSFNIVIGLKIKKVSI